MIRKNPISFSLLLFFSFQSSRSLSYSYSKPSQYLIGRNFKVDKNLITFNNIKASLSSTSSIPIESNNKYDIYKKKKGKLNKEEEDEENQNLSKTQIKKNKQMRQLIENQTNLFNSYYIEQFGEERWNSLRKSLAAPVKYVAMGNKYSDFESLKKMLRLKNYNLNEENPSVPYIADLMKNIYILESDLIDIQNGNLESPKSQSVTSSSSDNWPSPSNPQYVDLNGLYTYYPLDAASLIPVSLLQLESHHSVLDVCSAPGGKALAILQNLELSPNDEDFDENDDTDEIDNSNNTSDDEILNNNSLINEKNRGYGKLVCNDVSFDRRIRLKHVISNYLPKELSKKVRIRGYDATSSKFPRQISYSCGQFDRILLDAPCASERHLIQSGEEEIIKWSSGRSRNNAERQLNLLLNSLSVLKIDGILVYSTCAVTNIENDNVIKKMLDKIEKKKLKLGYNVELVPLNNYKLPFGEKTKFGWHILPDQGHGWGPIYLSVLKKISNEK